MHELALADAIVAIASRNASDGRVTRVEVKVGRLRQVVPDALVFAFELVASGTAVEGAELVLEEVPARVACRACGTQSEAHSFPLTCDRCGELEVEVVGGDELFVDALEIEREPVTAGRR
jgi:hydrogenase nickel incorporation protein HypA/HybF